MNDVDDLDLKEQQLLPLHSNNSPSVKFYGATTFQKIFDEYKITMVYIHQDLLVHSEC
jgi:hypothetical protein